MCSSHSTNKSEHLFRVVVKNITQTNTHLLLLLFLVVPRHHRFLSLRVYDRLSCRGTSSLLLQLDHCLCLLMPVCEQSRLIDQSMK